MKTSRIAVVTAQGSYDVLVGPGAVSALNGLLPKSSRRAAIVTQENIGIAVDTGLDQEVFLIPPGEGAKSLATIEKLCRAFSRFSLTRNDVVVAVGGGVVTDIAGFAASIYHRGVNYVNVATSLLAQVDASVGGKTGVNIPEGKNLVGSFWQPRGVICDTDHLATLPTAEMSCGYGEMAKYAFLSSPSVPALDVKEMLALSLSEQVARCVALKAAVVAEDERELTGRRAVLNYGHTLAHALEATGLASGSGGSIRHGEAVAIGLAFAARLAEALGRISAQRVAEHDAVLRAYRLSGTLPERSDPETLAEYMAGDKKGMFSSRGGGLTFVLDGPEGVELVGGIDPVAVVALLRDMARDG